MSTDATEMFTESRNPATGELLGKVPLNHVSEVQVAIDRIRIAQIKWASTPIHERAQHLRKMQRHLAAHADEFSKRIAADNGKTYKDAFATEIFAAILGIDYYIKHSHRVLKDSHIRGSGWFGLYKRHRIQHVPWGVVGIISPWNYPLQIPFTEILMALMAGNGVIFKMATETLQVGQLINEIITAGEFPNDLFVQVNLPGRQAGDAFLESGIDKLFFTGSVPVGKYLMAKAAETLTPVSLELGGNDPMIVCADANVKRAVRGAIWAGFQNAGQSCGGVERIYVDRSAYEPFLDLFQKQLTRLKVGNGLETDSDIGAMTTLNQVNTVKEHVADALKNGAELLCQTETPADSGQFLPARAFINVNNTMRMMREESFGPVVGIMPFDSEEEAIRLANDSDLGLTASVWSKNRKRAFRIASQLEAGTITINDHLMTHGIANLPWGGFKQSGLGRTHGKLGLEEMTQPRLIVSDFTPVNTMPWWLPMREAVYQRLVGAAMVFGGSASVKWAGLKKLIRGR
ncbi:MAG: aldehyde dehydrogenase family protein [Candidatus Marinimicrobia bacterium]|nr:aldehyde dehydrogenase family protein [Candidatus Neomarinimicrobiota bacterium]MCF7840885.1 aldehyde dehydrogenase family protein [Candidatus Neomarinimicrobiota bacterium]MCF7903070.1 aldehyde dehydrogenase family protein [Candidatus Neomarinimicrobiota bacterium]